MKCVRSGNKPLVCILFQLTTLNSDEIYLFRYFSCLRYSDRSTTPLPLPTAKEDVWPTFEIFNQFSYTVIIEGLIAGTAMTVRSLSENIRCIVRRTF
jgi:hypothetical protein